MQLYMENETDISFDFDTEEIAKTVINKVLEVEDCPFDTEVNLLITDNEGIREYNVSRRGIDKPTDVLSFPGLFFENPSVFFIPEEEMADYTNPESDKIILGDIIISADKVISQAEEYGHGIERELAFLAVHSILHLLGYDHEKGEEEEKIQFSATEEILESIGLKREG